MGALLRGLRVRVFGFIMPAFNDNRYVRKASSFSEDKELNTQVCLKQNTAQHMGLSVVCLRSQHLVNPIAANGKEIMETGFILLSPF